MQKNLYLLVSTSLHGNYAEYSTFACTLQHNHYRDNRLTDMKTSTTSQYELHEIAAALDTLRVALDAPDCPIPGAVAGTAYLLRLVRERVEYLAVTETATARVCTGN